MAGQYDITVNDSGFTATVTQNDAGEWSWVLNRGGKSVSGSFSSTFAFTSAFNMGANSDYAFGAGSVVSPGTWSGSVTYPSAAAITTT